MNEQQKSPSTTEEARQDFWISWYSPEPMSAFELHSPWWVSGYTDTENIVVAAVRAESEAAAWEVVRDAYDYTPELRERFIEPLTSTPFSVRFQQAKWMRWDQQGTCACPEHTDPRFRSAAPSENEGV